MSQIGATLVGVRGFPNALNVNGLDRLRAWRRARREAERSRTGKFFMLRGLP